MRSRILLLCSLIIVAVLAGLWLLSGEGRFAPEPREQAATPSADSQYRLVRRDCDFNVHWRAHVECADLYPPVVDTPSGELAFRLPVVIIRASGSGRKPDPLLYLQGGPGAPARLDRSGIEAWIGWLDYAGLKRDLVLMDRRGAGRSEPDIRCAEYDQFSRDVLAENTTLLQELEQGSEVLQGCYEQLVAQQQFDPGAFGTRANARDVAALMEVLDYPEWNLLGVSYGSRLAMAVAERPEVQSAGLVRSLILDSVYPPDQGGLLTWPQVMTEGMERFIRWCADAEGCAGSQNRLDEQLTEALAALRREPMSVTIPRWQNGGSQRVIINDHRLLSAVFNAIYQRHRWPDIPQALNAVQARDSDGLKPLIEPFVNLALDQDFSSFAFMAVDCQDHILGTEEDYQKQVEAFPRFARYLESLWQWQSCHWLGAAEEPIELQPPPEVPTLMLAGALDPITPLQWARDLAEHWPQSQLYRVKGVGHSVIGSDSCVHGKLADFLNDPEEKWEPGCATGE